MIEHTHVEFLMFKDMFLMINSLLFETLMLFLQLHIVASTTTISAGWPPVFASSLRQPCFSQLKPDVFDPFPVFLRG